MTTVLEHRYRPRGAARSLFEDQRSEILLSGPAGTGKSRACLEKLHAAALKHAGMRGLVLRKTLVSLGSTALVTWRTYVVAEALEAGTVVYYGGSAEEPPQYRYDNGSVVVIGGLDKPTRIMSSEYDMIYVQEAIELTAEDWESVLTRLRYGRVPYQQLIADTNPERPTHWLNERCQRGQCVMYQSTHEDNPLLVDEQGRVTEFGREYIAKLDALTGVRYLRLRKGLWVAAEGVIYEDWNPAVHLLDPFDVPYDWPRYWVVDFGYTNPFVLQWWAQDPDGRVYLYRELYMTGRTVDQHAVNIMDCVSVVDPEYRHPAGERRRAHHGRVWTEPRPVKVICDHDAEDRATLEKELGLSTRPAHKAVSPGIQAMQQRMRKAGDGRPRWFLCRDTLVERDQALVDAHKPTCSAEEVAGYVWAVPPRASADRKAPPEEPRKLDDHGMDCSRYLCADLDIRKRAGVRWL